MKIRLLGFRKFVFKNIAFSFIRVVGGQIKKQYRPGRRKARGRGFYPEMSLIWLLLKDTSVGGDVAYRRMQQLLNVFQSKMKNYQLAAAKTFLLRIKDQ